MDLPVLDEPEAKETLHNYNLLVIWCKRTTGGAGSIFIAITGVLFTRNIIHDLASALVIGAFIFTTISSVMGIFFGFQSWMHQENAPSYRLWLWLYTMIISTPLVLLFVTNIVDLMRASL